MGAIYPKLNYQLVTAMLLMTGSVMIALVPWMGDIVSLMAVFTVSGMLQGFVEAGANVYLLELWGKETSPFMQLLHCSYSLGALFGPVLAAPFLSVSGTEDTLDGHLSPLTRAATVGPFAGNGTEAGVTVVEIFHADQVNLTTPYSVVSVLLFVTSISGFLVWRISPTTKPHPSRRAITFDTPFAGSHTSARSSTSLYGSTDTPGTSRSDKAGEIAMAIEEINPKHGTTPTWKVMVVVSGMIFMLAFYGIEQGLGSFLVTFAVKSRLGLSKQRGAEICSTFWAFFALSRIPKIFMIDCMGNDTSIFSGLVVLLTGCAVLLPLGQDSEAALWTGVILVGVGGSSLCGCIFGYLEEHFEVTSVIGSLIYVSALVGEFVFPVIISHLIESQPLVLFWVILACTMTMLASFSVIFTVCRRKLKCHDRVASAIN